MAQGEGFNHITVTAADEDDVVIVAGASALERDEPEPVEPARDVETTRSSEDFSVESVGTHGGFPVEPVGASSSSPARAARASQRPETHRGAVSASDGGYRETTLEDLERKPMPFAQKATIIAAIALIAVAVIYYFVAMH